LQIDHENPAAHVQLPTDDLVQQWLPGVNIGEPKPLSTEAEPNPLTPTKTDVQLKGTKRDAGALAAMPPRESLPDPLFDPRLGEKDFCMPREVARLAVRGERQRRVDVASEVAAQVAEINSLSELKCYYALDMPIHTDVKQ
jgi:hypothetical protein